MVALCWLDIFLSIFFTVIKNVTGIYNSPRDFILYSDKYMNPIVRARRDLNPRPDA